MRRLRLYLSTLYVYTCTPYEYIRVTRIRSEMFREENTITPELLPSPDSVE